MPRKGIICLNCQGRHLKCIRDVDSEPCRRCKLHGVVCQQDSTLRVRNVGSVSQRNPQGKRKRRHLEYAEDQVWVPVPPCLDFASPEQHNAPPPDDGEVFHSQQPQEQQHQPQGNSLSPAAARSTPSNNYENQPHSPAVARSTPNNNYENQSPELRSASSIFTPIPQDLSGPQTESAQLYNPVSPWPFESLQEAHLFLHFVQRLSGLLDAFDSSRHFGTVVPRRAAYVPVIMNAILASSARHIAFISKTEDTKSERYHGRCLQILIPVLDNPSDELDENLCAAIVILRQYEEFDEADERCHLFGSTRMVNSIAPSATSTSLREACNWVALRQEIHISLTNKQPVSIVLDAYRNSSYFHSDAEDAWANRIVFLFAKVLNYAFRSSETAPEESWFQLEEEVEAWNIAKPSYFSPLWMEDMADQRQSPFPHVAMLGSSQVNGMQHYCLAKILLAAYDPRLLKLGFGARKLRKDSEETVLQNLRMVVGLAISNPQYECTFMHASHILSACGDYYIDQHEQDAVIEFLNDIEQRGVWRTSPIAMRLREQWN